MLRNIQFQFPYYTERLDRSTGRTKNCSNEINTTGGCFALVLVPNHSVSQTCGTQSSQHPLMHARTHARTHAHTHTHTHTDFGTTAQYLSCRFPSILQSRQRKWLFRLYNNFISNDTLLLYCHKLYIILCIYCTSSCHTLTSLTIIIPTS